MKFGIINFFVFIILFSYIKIDYFYILHLIINININIDINLMTSLKIKYLDKLDISESIYRKYITNDDDYCFYYLIYKMNFEDFKDNLEKDAIFRDDLLNIENNDNNDNRYNFIHLITLFYKYDLMVNNINFDLESNYCKMFKYLIDNHIDINSRTNTKHGDNILYIFFNNNINTFINYDKSIDIIRFLLKNNADPNQKTLKEPFLSPFQFLALKIYELNQHNSRFLMELFELFIEMIKYGGNIYELFTVKRINAIYHIHNSGYSKFVTKNENIDIVDLFSEIDSNMKNNVLNTYNNYIYDRRKNILDFYDNYLNNLENIHKDSKSKSKSDSNIKTENLTIFFNNENSFRELLSYIN